MKLNLTIDCGNTCVKLSLFNGMTHLGTERFEKFDVSMLKPVFDRYDIGSAIMSSVADSYADVRTYVSERVERFIQLSHSTAMPVKLAYRSVSTLGCDRIATAVGAWCLGDKCHDLLVIDAGSAITTDVVNAAGTFVGGNISPGMMMRFKALNTLTKRLPLVERDGDLPLLGYDTPTAMRSGVIFGVRDELNACIARLKERYQGLQVFLTGGDSKFLAPMLDHNVRLDEHLLAKGLNTVLRYNESL